MKFRWLYLVLMLGMPLPSIGQVAWLIVPSQIWSDGQWRASEIIRFEDIRRFDYKAATQCNIARHSIVNGLPHPSYSLCTTAEPDYFLWQ